MGISTGTLSQSVSEVLELWVGESSFSQSVCCGNLLPE